MGENIKLVLQNKLVAHTFIVTYMHYKCIHDNSAGENTLFEKPIHYIGNPFFHSALPPHSNLLKKLLLAFLLAIK